MSLSFRIGAFFLAAVALLLGGFSIALYLLARMHFQRDLDERLTLTLDALSAAAEIEPDRIEWRSNLHQPLALGHPGEEPADWVVYDQKGRVVDQSMAIDFSGILGRIPEFGHVHLSHTDRDGRRWRLASRRLRPPLRPSDDDDPDEDDKPVLRGKKAVSIHSSLVLASGAPLAPMEASLRQVGLVLAGLSTGLWLLAAAAGRYLGRRALLPVTRMARAAHAMTASAREQRLPSPGTGDELEDLAQSFNGLLERLREALDRQSRFTGDASHQLRTPLTSLISEVELALRRDRTADDYRWVLNRVLGDAVRLRQIVESLLFLARADAEAERPALEPIDLAAWLTDYLRHRVRNDRAGDIRCDALPEAAAWARVHPPLLGQLLDNLLDNACKYSAAGTPIVVGLTREPGWLALAVEDRGTGIAAGDVPRIFDPFYRSEQARLRGLPGFGLGLAMVQRIAAAFGGSASAASELGRGSRFVIRLPEADPPAAAEILAAAGGSTGRGL